jgi:hypothetical protein
LGGKKFPKRSIYSISVLLAAKKQVQYCAKLFEGFQFNPSSASQIYGHGSKTIADTHLSYLRGCFTQAVPFKYSMVFPLSPSTSPYSHPPNTTKAPVQEKQYK